MKKKIILSVITFFLFLFFVKTYGQPLATQYDLAYSLFLNNNYRLSEALFNSFTAIHPEDALAGNSRFMAGETEYATGQYKKALESYISIIEKYRDAGNKYKKELYYRAAECYYQLKDYENSTKYIKLLLKNYPVSYLTCDAYLLLGENLFLTENYDVSIDALNHMEDYTDYIHFDYVYYLKGRVYYEKSLVENDDMEKDLKEAIRYFDRVKNEFPQSRIINHSEFRKANAYYALKQYEKSIKIISVLIEKEDDYKFKLLMKYFLAWNNYMIKQYKKAIDIYDSIIDDYGTDLLAAWSEYKKGLCFEAQGNEAAALEQYKRVLTKHPDTIPSAYAQYAIGQYYYNKGNYDEALSSFEEVVSKYNIDELNRAVLFLTADIYISQGNYGRAADIYKKIEKTYVDDASNARYMQGWCKYKAADYNGALEIYNILISDSSVLEDIKAKAVLKSGDVYFEMGRLEEADKFYDEVIKSYRKSTTLLAEAYYGKGWILYSKNKFDEALAMFEKTKATAGDRETKLKADFMRANTFYGQNKFDSALSIFTDIMDEKQITRSMKEDSVFYAAWCYYRKEKFDLAVDFWKKYQGMTNDPVKKAEAQYRIGWCYFRVNEFDKATEAFAVILNNYQSTHLYQEAILKTGDSYYNKKEYEKAILYYKQIVDNFPQHYRVGEALYGIQWSYYQLDQPEKAVELSKAFVDKYPDSSFTPEIQYRIAEHYYNNAKYDTAVLEFKRFIDKNPVSDLSDNAYYWMGVSHMNLKNYGEAVNDFKDMIVKYPTTPFAEKAEFKSAGCYYKQRDFTNAAAAYQAFINKYKDSTYSAEAFFNLAMSYKRIGDIENTKIWYKKLIEEHKDSPLFERANMNLAYLYQDNKEYDEAIAVFNGVVEMKKDKAVEAQFWIGDCYSAKKDLKQAALEYMKVYENYKTETLWAISALDAAGKIYEKNGELKSAISCYKKILNVTKEAKYTDTAKKKIELLEEQYKLLHPATEGGPVKGSEK